jgi:hypothetical protein
MQRCRLKAELQTGNDKTERQEGVFLRSTLAGGLLGFVQWMSCGATTGSGFARRSSLPDAFDASP